MMILTAVFLVGTSVYFLYVVRSHSQRMSLAFYYIVGLAQAQGSAQLLRSLAEIQGRYLSLLFKVYAEIKPLNFSLGGISEALVGQVRT